MVRKVQKYKNESKDPLSADVHKNATYYLNTAIS